MKKSFILSFLFLSFVSYAQDTTFNRLDHTLSSTFMMRGVQKLDSTYFLLATQLDTPNYYNYINFGILKYNSNFELIDSTIIKPHKTVVCNLGKGFEIDYSDSSFVFCGCVKYHYNQIQNGYLVKFNKNLDTVWTKQIFHPDSSYADTASTPWTVISDIKITPSGDYLMTGSYNHHCQGGYNNSFLMKTDSDGNILWQKFLNPSIYMTYVTNIEIDPVDSGFYFLCYTGGAYGAGGYMSLFKYDKNGNFLWNDSIGIDFLTSYISKIKVIGNQVIIGTNYYKLPYTLGDDMLLYVCSYNQQTHTLNWGKRFQSIRINSSYLRQEVIEIEETQSGNIAIGTVGEGLILDSCTPDTRAHLVLMSSNGDSLWSRYYCFQNDTEEERMQLNDVEVCDDGGFLLAGSCYRYLDDPGYIRAWMAKTDSMGFCPASYTLSINKDELIIKNKMMIYPNPTSNTINLRFSQTPNKTLDLRILNSSGILVMQKELSAYAKEERIDVSELASGIYFVKIISDDGEIYSGKVIKQ